MSELETSKYGMDTGKSEGDTPQMSVLCEEFEDDGGIREYYVLAISEDKEALMQLLRAKVEKDEYGYFEKYGVSEDMETVFSSTYPEDGYGQVSYYILTQDVLNRDQVLAKLNEPEYSSEFVYPDNMREICLPLVKEMIEEEGYDNIQAELALDKILEHRAFRADMQSAWWFDPRHLDGTDKDIQNRMTRYIGSFIDDRHQEDPKWFETIGAATLFAYPDNLKDILIAAFYDVSRDYKLPVHDAEQEAGRILKNGPFRAQFKPFGTDFLEQGTDRLQKAYSTCYAFVKERRVPEHKKDPKHPRFDTLLADAINRRGTSSPAQNKEQEKDR